MAEGVTPPLVYRRPFCFSDDDWVRKEMEVQVT